MHGATIKKGKNWVM